jgi:hypothetical protein
MSLNRFTFSIILVAFALVFWFEMFVLKNVNFWVEMLFASCLLASLGLYINHKNGEAINYRLYYFQPVHIIAGLLSAAILYGLFYAGDRLAAVILPFAKQNVESIYANRQLMDVRIIAVLLVVFIGPAEEVFWRGFVQDTLQEKFGRYKGWIIASLAYAGVHLVAWNFMLFIAALVCGLFWGFIFLKYKTLWPAIISHAVWDFTVFVLLPIK